MIIKNEKYILEMTEKDRPRQRLQRKVRKYTESAYNNTEN